MWNVLGANRTASANKEAAIQKPEILMLFQYDAWSNAKILEPAGNVTVEQFAAAELALANARS